HLVDRAARHRVHRTARQAVVRADILAAGPLQNLLRLRAHVLAHAQLVLAPGGVNAQDRDSPGIRLLRQLHVVVFPREALALGSDAHRPSSGVAQDLLALRPDLRQTGSAAPTLPTGSHREVIAAHESQPVGIGPPHVAEAWDDLPCGPVSLVVAVPQARNSAARTDPHVVVHQVTSEHSAVAPEAIRMTGAAAVEQ